VRIFCNVHLVRCKPVRNREAEFGLYKVGICTPVHGSPLAQENRTQIAPGSSKTVERRGTRRAEVDEHEHIRTRGIPFRLSWGRKASAIVLGVALLFAARLSI